LISKNTKYEEKKNICLNKKQTTKKMVFPNTIDRMKLVNKIDLSKLLVSAQSQDQVVVNYRNVADTKDLQVKIPKLAYVEYTMDTDGAYTVPGSTVDLFTKFQSLATASTAAFSTAGDDLKTESDRSIAAEAVLSAAITAEAKRATDEVKTESDRSLAAESVLSDAIVAEAKRATDEVKAESDRAIATELVLANAVEAAETKEKDRAKEAERILTNSIALEEYRAKVAERDLTIRVNNVLANVDTTKLDSFSEILNEMASSENGSLLAAINTIWRKVVLVEALLKDFYDVTNLETLVLYPAYENFVQLNIDNDPDSGNVPVPVPVPVIVPEAVVIPAPPVI
jgi:hypothetical protein